MFVGINRNTKNSRKRRSLTCKESDQDMFKSCIFLIDDEEIITDVISHFLTQYGFTNVHSFNDPVEAIETMQYVRTDLVVTDVNMPGLGGNYLTRLARKMDHLAGIPIIGVTSDTTGEAESKLLANGACRVLHKPIQQKDMLMCVVTSLDQRLKTSELDLESFREEQLQRANANEEKMRDVESALRAVFRKP